jgi:hypothetical protein
MPGHFDDKQRSLAIGPFHERYGRVFQQRKQLLIVHVIDDDIWLGRGSLNLESFSLPAVRPCQRDCDCSDSTGE